MNFLEIKQFVNKFVNFLKSKEFTPIVHQKEFKISQYATIVVEKDRQIVVIPDQKNNIQIWFDSFTSNVVFRGNFREVITDKFDEEKLFKIYLKLIKKVQKENSLVVREFPNEPFKKGQWVTAYHETRKKFENFDISKSTSKNGIGMVWFISKVGIDTGIENPLYLKICKIKINSPLSDDNFSKKFDDDAFLATEAGYDGVVSFTKIKNLEYYTYCVFDVTNVKVKKTIPYKEVYK